MSNMFYRFIEHTFIPDSFKYFTFLKIVEKEFPLKVITPVLL